MDDQGAQNGRARQVGLRIPPEIGAQIIDHARGGYPDEVCGLVAGRGGAATAMFPGRNISPTPASAYELDHRTLARIAEIEDAGLELVAIYHSHPRGPEGPSVTDIERADFPGAVCIVVNLGYQCPVLRGFRITAESVQEVEVETAAEGTGFLLT